MKKGINIWSFPDNSLEYVFDLAKRAGFEGVELSLDNEGEVALNSTEKQLLEVRRLAKDSGIELYSLACGMCWGYWLNDDDPKMREKAKDIVKRQLEAASVLGCESTLVLPGVVNADFAVPGKIVDYETTYNRSLEAVNELKVYAEQYKVELGLENVWNKFLVSPIEMRDYIDKIGSRYVKCYFDVGNVLINGYPEHWIRILRNRINKVHIKDYRVAAGGLHGFVDLLAGDVNFPAVMDALRSVGYDGWLTAEMSHYKYYKETMIFNTSNAMDSILGR